MSESLHYQFGCYSTTVTIHKTLPRLDELAGSHAANSAKNDGGVLVVCDENTAPLARRIAENTPLLILPPGEDNKNWQAVETILRAAKEQGLGRDGTFIGIGGGVVCDLTAFAASIYMRGAGLVLAPTTLLCMVDAALGGKTGFDLSGLKNLAGTFYPASSIHIAAEALETLPPREWKSGLAELIKTAVLSPDPAFFEDLAVFTARSLRSAHDWLSAPCGADKRHSLHAANSTLLSFIEQALCVKGTIVEADPRETGGNRALLNLGHTFGHALESVLGLGRISHGEAVAWGMARSCELGTELGITPPERGEALLDLLAGLDYAVKPAAFGRINGACFRTALLADKKKKAGKPRFVVPSEKGAVLVEWNVYVETYVETYMDRLCSLLAS